MTDLPSALTVARQPGYTEFEFDLPAALLKQLVATLDGLEPAPLALQSISAIPQAQGVYQLFLRDRDGYELVYIGKTDSKHGLRNRLVRHEAKIDHRLNIDPKDIFFKAVRIYVFTAVDLEAQLIRRYGGNKKVRWNGSGFGANDVGKERDTTVYKADHFDTLYPIDLNRPFDGELPASGSAAEVLNILKRDLPYTIRFHLLKKNSKAAHADLEATNITVDRSVMISPADIIEHTVRHLPSGWHATVLPSHVIIYKDDDRKFPSGRLIHRT